LRSEHLRLSSENDAYALVSGWVASQEESIDDPNGAFSELVRCLRFHHMTPTFIACAVFQSERWEDCPFLAQACSRAMAYQSMAKSFRKVPIVDDPVHPFASAKPSRARKKKGVTYTFKLEVPLSDCLPLEQDESAYFRLGVAEGYMVSLTVTREAEGDDAHTLALYVDFECPDAYQVDDDEDTDTVGLSGPMVALRVDAADTFYTFANLFVVGLGHGAPDFFGRPWEEVVREGSDYFPEGRMPVTVDVHFIADKHVKPHVPWSDVLSERAAGSGR
jgi:hypothetical protein